MTGVRILHAWVAAAIILAGLTWIPVRLGVSASWNSGFVRLSYVEWNQLMVIPLGLMLAVLVAWTFDAPGRSTRIGAGLASVGLAGAAAGIVIEFFVAGGLAGDRGGAIIGWTVYLGGLALHAVGLIAMGMALTRSPGRRGPGALWILIGVLHVAWVPAGLTSTELLVADQVAIGFTWVLAGVMLWTASRRPAAA